MNEIYCDSEGYYVARKEDLKLNGFDVVNGLEDVESVCDGLKVVGGGGRKLGKDREGFSEVADS